MMYRKVIILPLLALVLVALPTGVVSAQITALDLLPGIVELAQSHLQVMMQRMQQMGMSSKQM